MNEKRKFRCSDCGYSWELAYGTGRPLDCPHCKSSNIHRASEDRGYSRQRRGGCGRGSGKRSGSEGERSF